jgi:two-component system NtrC family sensor kinase
MEQVVLNLLGNAVQAIADGPGRGTITVGLVAIDGKLRMSFTDDGPGIPQDVLPRIFEPFFTTKPVGKGTGLGLSICRSILREHGGDIRVESTLRRGTTFVAELPAVPVAATEPEQVVRPLERPVSYTMLRVLCVDDEPAVVEMLSRALGGLGHQVDQSQDGAEALRMVHLADYDAVLLDLRMPGLGGPEVYRCIQGLRPDLTDRVLFMTGDTVSPDTRAFIESTGADILQKPFSLDELRRRMEQFAFAKDQRVAARERARRPDLAAGLTKIGRPLTK